MSIFTDTITIYNYHKDSNNSDAWNKTVLSGVQVSQSSDKTKSSDGIVNITDTINITIPFNLLSNYIDYVSYSKLPYNKAIKHFTLNHINNLDVIVNGNIDKQINSSYKITSLKNDYAECGTISGVRDNTTRSRLKNIKVVLK